MAFLAGSKHSTEAWAVGAEGEQRIGGFLNRAVGDRGVVLHDRRVSRGRANLDHLAIVPSAVWVIDSKHYRGRLERRGGGGLVSPRERRSMWAAVTAPNSWRRPRDSEPRWPITCHPTSPSTWRCASQASSSASSPRPFVLEGVLVTWPKALAKRLTQPGALDAATRHELATLLATAFPPYT